MSALLAALALLIFELCLIDWRIGLFLVPVMGIVQEPLRKVVPGEPVAIVLLAGGVFATTVAGMALRHRGLGLVPFLEHFRALRQPLLLVIGWLSLQHVLTVVRYQNIALFGIGLISYFLPLLAVVVGFRFTRAARGSLRPVRSYLVIYLLLASAAVSGILLDYLGVESALFEPVGEGIVLYDTEGVLRSYSGFFRSSEIAAWHGSAALCLLLALASGPGRRWTKVVATALCPFLLAGVVLTGRRKALMVLVLFLSIFSFLLATQRRRRVATAPVLLLLAGLAFGLYIGDFFNLNSPEVSMENYLRRGGTVFGDATARFRLLGLNSIWWALERFGLLGIGAGVLGQGGQHFGAGSGVFGGSGEGGLGKITGELGLPGLLLFGWIALRAMGEARRVLQEARAAGPEEHTLTAGLMALVAANLPSFIVASQAFGDPFVVLSLGLFVGFAAGMSSAHRGAPGLRRTVGLPAAAVARWSRA